jgi:hypothetical protein
MPILRKSLAVFATLVSIGLCLAAAPSAALAWGHHGGGHGWAGHGWAGHGWAGHGWHHGWGHYGYGYFGGPSVYVYGGPDWGWDYPYEGGWEGPGVAPYPGNYPPPMRRPGEGHYCATPSRICELPPGGKIGATCSCPVEAGRAYGHIHN